MKKTVLVAAALVVAGAIGYVWQIVGATGPALPLRVVGDFPLTGSASRFDYASLDPSHGVLWLAHMGDGTVEAFDVKAHRVTLTVPISPQASVRGILVARGKVYAAAQGLGAVVVLDPTDGKRIATIPGGDVDGLAYDPATQRIFVSDEGGGRDVVIDARADRTIGRIALGGEAGNTQYDSVSHHVFVGVQTRNELAEIDPATLKLLRRYQLSGCRSSHSVAIDSAAHAAYIGCQQNARLVRLDLGTGRVTASGGVGIGIDVLALDPGRHRLYVGSESGVVSVYDVAASRFDRIAQAFLALHAHVVAVDAKTHRVYFPLQSVAGKPAIREMEPR
jgi:DNA-binding beta-propeller fold protein YncE